MSSDSHVHGTIGRQWERLRNVPGLGRDLLALAAVAVVGVVSATVLLSNTGFSLPWSSRFTFKVELSDAIGVSPGNSQEVRIAGVKVGQIVDSEPTDHNTSLVTLSMDPGHPVFINARAVLRPVNPLNQMYISINPGGPPAPRLVAGGVIPVAQTSRPIQPEELLGKLDERSRAGVTALLEESDNVLANPPDTIPTALQASDVSLTELRPVAERLAARSDNLRRLVTALSQISTALGGNDARLTSLINSTQQTLDVLAKRDDELRQSLGLLPPTLDALHHSMDSTAKLATQLNPTLDNVRAASDELPDALKALKSAVGPLHDTVDAARPVLSKARPIVDELVPTAGDLHAAVTNLKPLAQCLDDVTSKIAPWMYDLAGFVYNTNDIATTTDPNGGWARGELTVATNAPTGGLGSNDTKTNTYQQGGSPLGAYPALGSGECRR